MDTWFVLIMLDLDIWCSWFMILLLNGCLVLLACFYGSLFAYLSCFFYGTLGLIVCSPMFTLSICSEKGENFIHPSMFSIS